MLVHSNAVSVMYTYMYVHTHTHRLALFCFATRIGSWLNTQGSQVRFSILRPIEGSAMGRRYIVNIPLTDDVLEKF